MKALLVEVTVYDTDTCRVEKKVIKHYDGSFGFEVERMFDALGREMGEEIEPDHYS